MAGIENKFSLIVTCYNFEDFLPDCLDSLVNQDYSQRDYEIVCVDDGSTDGSATIMGKYKKRFENLSMLCLQNSGLEKACNTGIRASRYDWVVRVDSDDRLDPYFLSVMNRAINRRPEFDFYYCKDYFEYYSDAERHEKHLPDFSVEEIFTRGDFFATGTVYKKKNLAEIGYFPEAVKNCGLENYNVVLELLKKNKKGLAVSGTWFDYRRHHANMSMLRREAIVDFGHKLLKHYGRPFVTNEYHPYGLKLGAEEKRI